MFLLTSNIEFERQTTHKVKHMYTLHMTWKENAKINSSKNEWISIYVVLKTENFSKNGWRQNSYAGITVNILIWIPELKFN